jgi:hypothetical protein
MNKETELKVLEIPLEAELVDIYNNASKSDQLKIQMLLRLWIKEIRNPNPPSLREIMEKMGAEAQARGMTPEILEDILADDE